MNRLQSHLKVLKLWLVGWKRGEVYYCEIRKENIIEVLLGEQFCVRHTIPEPVTDSEDSVLAKERAKTEELTAKLRHLFSGSND